MMHKNASRQASWNSSLCIVTKNTFIVIISITIGSKSPFKIESIHTHTQARHLSYLNRHKSDWVLVHVPFIVYHLFYTSWYFETNCRKVKQCRPGSKPSSILHSLEQICVSFFLPREFVVAAIEQNAYVPFLKYIPWSIFKLSNTLIISAHTSGYEF